MRATGIRFKDLTKPTSHELKQLCETILAKTAKAGFITDANPLTGSAIKIGLHMSSFRIDTAKLGHNARISQWCKSPKGYKRTNVPTWDQRVEFNDIVNDVFDRWKLVANIKSGPFTVRGKTNGRRYESDWYNETPDYSRTDEIMPERVAREQLDSDKLEIEYKAATREARLELARARRKRMKLFNSARKVVVAGFFSWDGKPTKNGKLLTHAAFTKLLCKLGHYDRRRVRLKSIAATASQEELGF